MAEFKVVPLTETETQELNDSAASSRRAAFMQAPEISRTGIMELMRDSENPGPSIFGQQIPTPQELSLSALSLVTTDPFELGMILRQADPDIGIVQAPPSDGGEFFAVRRVLDADGNQTGEKIFNLNRKGLSPIDVLQGLGITSLGMIPGFAKTAATRTAGAGGLQAGIQATQSMAGGDFNAGEVVADAATQGVLDTAGTAFRAATRPRARGMVDEATERQATQLAEASSPGQIIDAAKNLDLDPAVIKAAEALGVTDLPLSAASRNTTFRAIDQAIRSIPASRGATAQREALQQLADESQVLIDALGRSDSLGLNDEAVGLVQNRIESLYTQADELFYDVVGEYIPDSTPINTGPILEYLEGQINRFGSLDRLPTQERALYNDITSAETPDLTYAYLDTLRKRIGASKRAAEKGTDGTPAFELGQLETALKDAQRESLRELDPTVINDFPIDLAGRFDAARRFVAMGKELEKQAQGVFGKDYTKAIMPTIVGGLKNITKANLGTFRKAMDVVPEEIRGRVVLSAIDDIFRQGAKAESGINMKAYSDWYDSLKSSEAAFAEVSQYLNPEQLQFIDNLGVVTKGWSNALRDQVSTGRIQAFLGQFDANGGFISRLANLAGGDFTRYASAITATMGEKGSGTITAMNDLLNDPVFRQMGIKYMMGQSTETLFDRLVQRAPFQIWLNTLPAENKKQILTKGLMFYLTDEESAALSPEYRARERRLDGRTRRELRTGIN